MALPVEVAAAVTAGKRETEGERGEERKCSQAMTPAALRRRRIAIAVSPAHRVASICPERAEVALARVVAAREAAHEGDVVAIVRVHAGDDRDLVPFRAFARRDLAIVPDEIG